MPSQPTPTDVHADRPLTDFSIAYLQDSSKYIAGKVFPVVSVESKSDSFYEFDREDWLREENVEKRSPGMDTPLSGFNVSTDTYKCDVYESGIALDDQTLANQDTGLNLRENAARVIAQRFLTHLESQFNSTFMTTGVWTTDVVGTTNFTQWDDAASDPEKDIDEGKITVEESTGFLPNTLVVGVKVHNALKRHPLIVDRIKHVSSESITNEIIAKFLEVDRYMVMRTTRATNNEGATAAYSYFNAVNAMLVYVDPSTGLMTPTAATTFAWSGLTGMNNLGVAMDSYRFEPKRSDIIRGQYAWDQKVTGADLGYFFSSAVAA